VIEMGPGAGDAGGRVVAQGTPEEIARLPESTTGQYLQDLVSESATALADPTGALSDRPT